MKSRIPIITGCQCKATYLIRLLLFYLIADSTADDWPQHRGPNSQGVSLETGLPTVWSESKNVLWKVNLPGKGSSSPVIFDDRIFLTAFSGYGLDVNNPGNPDDLERHLVCLERDTGRILWKKDIPNRGVVRKCEGFIGKHGYASHTPVTDGTMIYCWFGSHGAEAFDLDGNPVWRTGPFELTPTSFGSGASPIVYDDLLLINASLEGKVFVALEKKTGAEVWRRQGISSYTTPIVAKTPGGPELILNANNRLGAYDPRTGKDLWFHQPQKRNTTGYVIPSPILHNRIVYSLDRELVAVRCGGRGDVTSSQRIWRYDMFSVVPGPVFSNGYIFAVNDAILHCVRSSDGKLMYKERPNPRIFHVYASLLAADDKIYIIDRYGHSAVVKAGPEFELLSANRIEGDDSHFNASPAVSDGKLFIRSQKKLYCLARKDN